MQSSNDKKVGLTRKKKCFIISALVSLALITTGLIVYFTVFYGNDNGGYKPVGKKEIVYVRSSSSGKSNDTRLLTEEDPTFELTFIVLDQNDTNYVFIAVPGIVDQKELRNLRGLQKNNDTDTDTDTENGKFLGLFVFNANIQKGEITSFKYPPEGGQSIAGSVKASAQSWLLNSKKEKSLLSNKKRSSDKEPEFIGKYLFDTKIEIEEDDEHEIVTSTFQKSNSRDRRLEESESEKGINSLDVKKKSFVNKKTGNIDKTLVEGHANLDLVSYEGGSQETKQVDIKVESQTVFEKAGIELSDKDLEDLIDGINKEVGLEEYDLDGTGKPDVQANDTTDTNESEPFSNNGRSLIISETLNIKLFDVLGVEVRMIFSLTESGSDLRASSSISVGGLLSIDFGSHSLGSGILTKVRQIITLKNTLEDNIKTILQDVQSFADSVLTSHQQLLMAKFSEILTYLNDIEAKVLSSFLNLESQANQYMAKVNAEVSAHQKKIESEVLNKKQILENYLKENQDIQNMKNSIEQTKTLLNNEYNNIISQINDIKNQQIPQLEKYKADLAQEVNKKIEEIKNLDLIQELLNDYSNYLIEVIEKVKDELKKIEELEKEFEDIKGTVLNEINDKINQANSLINEIKSGIANEIIETKKNINDVKDKIKQEVDDKIAEINSEIDTIQEEIQKIDQALESAAETVKEDLLIQKSELESSIKQKQEMINNDLNSKKQELQNLVNSYEQEYKKKQEEMQNMVNKELEVVKDKISDLENEINQKAEIIKQIRDESIQNAENIKKQMQNVENDFNKYANEELINIKQKLMNQYNDEINKVLKYKEIIDEIAIKALLAKGITEDIEGLAAKEIKDIENEVKLKRDEIVRSIDNVNGEIEKAIEENKKFINDEIIAKKKELEEEISEGIKQEVEKKLSELQNEIDKLNELSLLVQSQVYDYIRKVENDAINTLIEQRNNYISSYQEMEQAILYLASKSFLKATQFITDLQSSIQSVQTTISSLIDPSNKIVSDLISTSSNIKDKTIIQIESQIESLSQSKKNLTDYITLYESRLTTLQLQIANFTNVSISLEIKINQISLNITSLTSLIGSKNVLIQQATNEFNAIKSTLDSIINGTFNWSSILQQKGLLQVRKMIEDSLIKPINDTLNTLKILRDTIKLIKDQFSGNCTIIKSDSDSKANKMAESSNGVFNLPTSETITSGAKLFDFAIFDDSLNKIRDNFNKMKTFSDNLGKLVSSNSADAISKTMKIFDIGEWENKINTIINNFKSLETKLKITLDYGDVKNFIINYVQDNFSKELNTLLNSFGQINDLIALVNDLSQLTLPKLLNSQAFKSTLINLLGPTQVITKNLYSFSKGWTISLPPIPTPVGTITVSLSISVRASVDLQTVLSLAKNSFAIAPSGGLSLFASAGWNFVIGEVGVGADISSNANLPIEVGFTFESTSFFVQGNFALNINGRAGVYYKIITINIGRKCWRAGWIRVCIPWITVSKSDARYIISSSYGTNYQTPIIPYKVLKVGR